MFSRGSGKSKKKKRRGGRSSIHPDSYVARHERELEYEKSKRNSRPFGRVASSSRVTSDIRPSGFAWDEGDDSPETYSKLHKKALAYKKAKGKGGKKRKKHKSKKVAPHVVASALSSSPYAASLTRQRPVTVHTSRRVLSGRKSLSRPRTAASKRTSGHKSSSQKAMVFPDDLNEFPPFSYPPKPRSFLATPPSPSTRSGRTNYPINKPRTPSPLALFEHKTRPSSRETIRRMTRPSSVPAIGVGSIIAKARKAFSDGNMNNAKSFLLQLVSLKLNQAVSELGHDSYTRNTLKEIKSQDSITDIIAVLNNEVGTIKSSLKDIKLEVLKMKKKVGNSYFNSPDLREEISCIVDASNEMAVRLEMIAMLKDVVSDSVGLVVPKKRNKKVTKKQKQKLAKLNNLINNLSFNVEYSTQFQEGLDHSLDNIGDIARQISSLRLEKNQIKYCIERNQLGRLAAGRDYTGNLLSQFQNSLVKLNRYNELFKRVTDQEIDTFVMTVKENFVQELNDMFIYEGENYDEAINLLRQRGEEFLKKQRDSSSFLSKPTRVIVGAKKEDASKKKKSVHAIFYPKTLTLEEHKNADGVVSWVPPSLSLDDGHGVPSSSVTKDLSPRFDEVGGASNADAQRSPKSTLRPALYESMPLLTVSEPSTLEGLLGDHEDSKHSGSGVSKKAPSFTPLLPDDPPLALTLEDLANFDLDSVMPGVGLSDDPLPGGDISIEDLDRANGEIIKIARKINEQLNKYNRLIRIGHVPSLALGFETSQKQQLQSIYKDLHGALKHKKELLSKKIGDVMEVMVGVGEGYDSDFYVNFVNSSVESLLTDISSARFDSRKLQKLGTQVIAIAEFSKTIAAAVDKLMEAFNKKVEQIKEEEQKSKKGKSKNTHSSSSPGAMSLSEFRTPSSDVRRKKKKTKTTKKKGKTPSVGVLPSASLLSSSALTGGALGSTPPSSSLSSSEGDDDSLLLKKEKAKAKPKRDKEIAKRKKAKAKEKEKLRKEKAKTLLDDSEYEGEGLGAGDDSEESIDSDEDLGLSNDSEESLDSDDGLGSSADSVSEGELSSFSKLGGLFKSKSSVSDLAKTKDFLVKFKRKRDPMILRQDDSGVNLVTIDSFDDNFASDKSGKIVSLNKKQHKELQDYFGVNNEVQSVKVIPKVNSHYCPMWSSSDLIDAVPDVFPQLPDVRDKDGVLQGAHNVSFKKGLIKISLHGSSDKITDVDIRFRPTWDELVKFPYKMQISCYDGKLCINAIDDDGDIVSYEDIAEEHKEILDNFDIKMAVVTHDKEKDVFSSKFHCKPSRLRFDELRIAKCISRGGKSRLIPTSAPSPSLESATIHTGSFDKIAEGGRS